MTAAARKSEVELTTHSPDETVCVGKRIGSLLRPGDVLALIGPLGAGKTLLVKGIALGIGVKDRREVTSPTFVLMNVHEGRLRLYHFDAYRLKSAGDMFEIGCEEAFYGDGACVVEWADRVGDCLPAEHLSIRFEIAGDTDRVIRFSAAGDRSRAIMAGMKNYQP